MSVTWLGTIADCFVAKDIRNSDKTLSDFKGHVFSHSDWDRFVSLIEEWIQTIERSRAFTLGYSFTTKNPDQVNVQAATFPPTARRMQVYPYKSKNSDKTFVGLDETAERNMLLVQNMTQNKPFPKGNALPYSGNWCTDEIPASLVISREVFLSDYLLRPYPTGSSRAIPLLSRISRAAYVEAKSATADLTKGGFKAEYKYSWGRPSSTKGYDWKEVKDSKTGDIHWEWQRSSKKTHQDGGKAFHARIEFSSTSPKLQYRSLFFFFFLLIRVANTTIFTKVPVGGNKIQINGKTTLKLYTRAAGFWIKQSGT